MRWNIKMLEVPGGGPAEEVESGQEEREVAEGEKEWTHGENQVFPFLSTAADKQSFLKRGFARARNCQLFHSVARRLHRATGLTFECLARFWRRRGDHNAAPNLRTSSSSISHSGDSIGR